VKDRRVWIIFWILLVGVVTACDSSEVESGFFPNAKGEITPYVSATATQFFTTPTVEFTSTPEPLPTPTPFIYTVVLNDTLLEIAWRFNIALDELMAANPEVDPYLLSVGMELVIPYGDGEEGSLTAELPTPVPIVETQPVCYPTRSDGLWCLWLVQNDNPFPLENLSAMITLYDPLGGKLTSQSAFAPLNVLRPGEAVPLMTFFPPPVPIWEGVQVQLITSLGVPGDQERYLNGLIENLQIQVSGNGLSARVSGTVRLQEDGKSASYVWLAAVAYDSDGVVVGAKRWEGAGIEENGSLEFDFQVFSLSLPIDRVEVLVEIRE
jgi:LysM repeat protein